MESACVPWHSVGSVAAQHVRSGQTYGAGRGGGGGAQRSSVSACGCEWAIQWNRWRWIRGVVWWVKTGFRKARGPTDSVGVTVTLLSCTPKSCRP